jgi:hypothetical protein
MVFNSVTRAQREVLEQRHAINGPVFSADGQRLAFFQWTDEHEQLFVIGSEGRGLQQVTRGHEPSIMPRWSADGASLFFFREEPPAFCRAAVAGGGVTALIEGWRWGSTTGAHLDRAGTRLVYTLVEKGAPRVSRVRDLASGRERDLARAIFVSSWSRDGMTIAGYTAEDEIALCPADGGPCRGVVPGSSPRFSADGKHLDFTRRGRAFDDPALRSTEVWSVSLDGSGERQVAVLEPQQALETPFDLSVGDEIAWVQFRRGKEELWLAERDGS